LACKSPALPHNEKCSDKQPKSTYKDKKANRWEDCEKNCEGCISATECIYCPNSLFLYKGDCIAACPKGTVKVDGNNVCRDLGKIGTTLLSDNMNKKIQAALPF